MSMSALDYARIAVDTLIDNYKKENISENARFIYHDGVFLSGVERVYALTGDEKYYNAIFNWVDHFVDEDGNLLRARFNQLDDLMPTRLMHRIYERTGDERYKKVLDFTMKQYENWETNEYGGFWHKDIDPNQMWLDSLYMASPNLVLYGVKYGKEEYLDMAYTQAKLMWDNMRDDRTGLLYHCWDPTKSTKWADPKTGLAPEFWGRALGWYAVTVFDLASYIPDTYTKKEEFIDNGISLINAILDYRDKNIKKWYQIVNRGNDPDNWIETSCSCLFTYAIAKGVNEGYLEESYKDIAYECFDGIINDIKINDGKIVIEDICIGTGVLTYGEYLERPRVANDLHGMGAFVLMCSEVAKLGGK